MKEEKITKQNIMKIILIILLLFLLGIIFGFSNQDGEKSTSLSREVTEKVTKYISQIQDLEETKKEEVLFNIEVIIRKLAHFSLYALVGILLMWLMTQYNIKDRNRIIYSLILGVIYAISDEIHQLFILDRTAQITDVLIDSLGILTGIVIVILFKKITKIPKNT